MLTTLLTTIALLFVLAAVGATARPGHGNGFAGTVVYVGTMGLCAVNAVTAVLFLTAGTGDAVGLVLPIGPPWQATHLSLDGLSAFFLLIVNGVGAMAALYGIGYGRHEEEPARVLPFFPVFLAGMNLVPLAADAFSFLVAWEFMSLSSWFLVLSSHRRHETRRAALVYLVMAAIGTAALIAAFGVLAGVSGDYGFAAIRLRSLGPLEAGAVMALVLIGAGSKAGVAPLHAWLPLAHPAAPSHVSALMSGVMTKVAVYAIVRVLFDLSGEAVWWWGLLMLGLGCATAGVGVLYAVVERDLKTLLAYSTVENIGLIMIGLGLAMAFKANGLTALAGLALLAALFHALNHSLYKSMLFFGAGAVLVSTGHRDLERLGGLIRKMPITSSVFLVGCISISALPPLNGFASEWLLLQAILSGPQMSQWGLKLAVPVAGAALVLATALAGACFVRAFGITFLGRPRSPEAASALRVDVAMRIPMVILAVACVLVGLLPVLALTPLTPVVHGLMGTSPVAAEGITWLWLSPVAERASSYSGLVLFLTVAVMAMMTLLIKRFVSGRIRRTPAWDCGFPDPSPSTQYTAASFAQPIRRMFGTHLFGAREMVDMPDPGDSAPARFSVEMKDPIWAWFYRPVVKFIGWTTESTNAFQFLTIREYLGLMFGVLVLLLMLVVVIR
ncbi:MAG: hydrogenase 4 subunit B [Alphaproteobacteria bacterium]|nr:hydrogenase 4 subunit B [Alphaproteobacteria bacterium]MBF0129665.1 hydrogenase 4 subunit B [Alphaproteobacteria bacterium]